MGAVHCSHVETPFYRSMTATIRYSKRASLQRMSWRVRKFVNKSIWCAEMRPGIAILHHLRGADEFDALRFHFSTGRGDVIDKKAGNGMGEKIIVRRFLAKDLHEVAVWQIHLREAGFLV